MDLATRKVTLTVTTEDGKDNGAVPCVIELDRGSGHVRVRGQDVVCNKGEATFLLAPGERLVIHGHTADAIEYDREQAAAVVKRQQIQDINKKSSPADVPIAEPTAPGTKPLENQAGVPKTKDEALARIKKEKPQASEVDANKEAALRWPTLFPANVDPTKPATQPGTVQTGQSGTDKK